MADETKNYVALLNGLAKQKYYGEHEITNEFLKQEIFPNLNDDEFDQLLSKCTLLLKVIEKILKINTENSAVSTPTF